MMMNRCNKCWETVRDVNQSQSVHALTVQLNKNNLKHLCSWTSGGDLFTLKTGFILVLCEYVVQKKILRM